nr:YaeQ family protein [Pseudomonas aeruginosa]
MRALQPARLWQPAGLADQGAGQRAQPENINVAAVPQEPLESLSRDLPRSINWTVMISEGTLFVTDENGQHELQLEWLQGER